MLQTLLSYFQFVLDYIQNIHWFYVLSIALTVSIALSIGQIVHSFSWFVLPKLFSGILLFGLGIILNLFLNDYYNGNMPYDFVATSILVSLSWFFIVVIFATITTINSLKRIYRIETYVQIPIVVLFHTAINIISIGTSRYSVNELVSNIIRVSEINFNNQLPKWYVYLMNFMFNLNARIYLGSLINQDSELKEQFNNLLIEHDLTIGKPKNEQEYEKMLKDFIDKHGDKYKSLYR